MKAVDLRESAARALLGWRQEDWASEEAREGPGVRCANRVPRTGYRRTEAEQTVLSGWRGRPPSGIPPLDWRLAKPG